MICCLKINILIRTSVLSVKVKYEFEKTLDWVSKANPYFMKAPVFMCNG